MDFACELINKLSTEWSHWIVMGTGAAEAGALDGLTGIGFVKPDDGKLLGV